ncbi:MAG TPA: ChaN family lipoprotein [Kofleriaceae bacterium]|nr:ChaN family lipoprotein [Kofleriaceae bacterium]
MAALAVAACGGTYGGAPVEHPKAGGGIEAAALPYQVVDARTGTSLDEPAFWAKLAAARAVCVGEEHSNPHHHWMQLHVVRELVHRLAKGTPIALAMEMFQRPFQGALDDYAAHKIDAQALRSRAGYADRWGYDYGFYGPTIDAAVAGGGQLVAANAARELTKKVAHHGLESLTADERAQLPELKLDDAAHRAWFEALMEAMGGSEAHTRKPDPPDASKPGPSAPTASPRHSDADRDDAAAPDDEMPSAERIYTVQVIWDETMADSSAKWLAAHPTGHLILLAGNGHCHDSAVVGRLKRRGVADAISIRGVLDDGEGSVADVLARPINDLLVVLQLPAGVERGPKPDDK